LLIGSNMARRPQPCNLSTNKQTDDDRNLRLAAAIWRDSVALPDQAIAYFASRGIDINAAPDQGGLRFHPSWKFDGIIKSCVIGRYTTAISNKPGGIWRRPLDGSKPKTLGSMSACVIRLWPDDAVSLGLVLGEGVETTLAAATRIEHRSSLLQPAWAAGSAGNMANFRVLPGIECLTLLVDHDASGTGQRAATTCSRRWTAAGREVTRLTPNKLGTDFNDVVGGAS
jgi:hypothetical protein